MKIAIYQQDIAWERPEANYEKMARALEAVGKGCDMMVVPETCSTGFSDNMATMAEEAEGATMAFGRAMAREHDALFVGTWAVREKDGRVYNRMHLIEPSGAYHTYDKAHTFRMSSEATQLARGEKQRVIEWRGWRLRPAVCYDLRFPKWLRNRALETAGRTMEYDLMVVCANWPASRHEAWSTLLKARAIENLCYVIGVNRTGTDAAGIAYTGDSAAIDYKGQEIGGCGHGGEGVTCVEIEREALETFRRHWPFYLDFD